MVKMYIKYILEHCISHINLNCTCTTIYRKEKIDFTKKKKIEIRKSTTATNNQSIKPMTITLKYGQLIIGDECYID